MTTTGNLQPAEKTTKFSHSSNQYKRENGTKKQNLALGLFWIGLLIAVAFAGIIGRSLYNNLRTLTYEELDATIWAIGGPMNMFWAFSVPLGSILAGIGAFIYAKTRPAFPWFTGFGVLGAVLVMNLFWSRVYDSTLFGIGGMIILVSFFSIVWIWMKKYATLDMDEKIAGSYKLIGYLFWLNASWFLCGETSKMHLRVFEGSPAPIPIEIMVFLVLGWLFVLLGEYKSRHLKGV